MDKVKSADIRESLSIANRFPGPERLQLRWYGHVPPMVQEKTAEKLLCSTSVGRGPKGRQQGRRQGGPGGAPPIDMLGTPINKLSLLKTAAFVLMFNFWPR